MTPYLTVTVYAPIGAMGGMVAAIHRRGWNRPARSAILGMVAAALGIERDDEITLQLLEHDTKIAVLVEREGVPFTDFHTIQAARGKSRWRTRAQELAAADDDDFPIVSYREYRTDVVFSVALSLRADSMFSLEQIRQALLQPRFVLYLGRKSCPLGMPLAPRIDTCKDAIAALIDRYRTGPERPFLNRISGRTKTTPYITIDDNDAVGREDVTRFETRADQLHNRRRWQFLPRTEAIIAIQNEADDVPLQG